MRIHKRKFAKWKTKVFDVWYAFGEPKQNKFLGNALSVRASFPYSSEGKTAAECLYIQESIGGVVPCREPEIADRAVIGRELLKVNMEMWEEGRADGTLPLVDWVKMCDELNLPDWVFYEVETRKTKFYFGTYREFCIYYAKVRNQMTKTIAQAKRHIMNPLGLKYSNLPTNIHNILYDETLIPSAEQMALVDNYLKEKFCVELPA